VPAQSSAGPASDNDGQGNVPKDTPPSGAEWDTGSEDFYEPPALARDTRDATVVLDHDAYVGTSSDAQYGVVINAGL